MEMRRAVVPPIHGDADSMEKADLWHLEAPPNKKPPRGKAIPCPPRRIRSPPATQALAASGERAATSFYSEARAPVNHP
jgi:hypothetical protein